MNFHSFMGQPPGVRRPLLGAGIRFGEADNPGPSMRRQAPEQIRFCFSNPTRLCKKQGIYEDLICDTDSHVLAISETAATVAMQSSFNHSMSKLGFQNVWCPPTPSLLQSVNNLDHERGRATGVVISSRVPCRPSRNKLPDEWSISNRFVHAVIQIGQSHIQVITIYGKPSSIAGSSRFNSGLLDFAIEQTSFVPLPFIIMGDWNQPIESLSSWPDLQDKGFQHLAQLHEKFHGCPMPPTCQGVTSNDTAILSPQLAGLVTRIQVLDSSWFATHSPVIFDLDIQGPSLFTSKFRLPRQLTEFSLETSELQKALDFLQPSSPDTLESWGETFEAVVDFALRNREASQALPASHKGRCKPTKVIKCPVMSPVRKASNGDFEPQCEVVSVASRRKIKQLRRIQSLGQRLRKLEAQGPSTPRTLFELQMEWQAILRATCFGSDFLAWCLYELGLPPPLWPIPSFTWVNELTQLVRFNVEVDLKSDESFFRAQLAYSKRLDQKDDHSRKAFRQVKGFGLPPIRELQQTVHDDVIVQPGESSELREIFGNKIGLLSVDFPLNLHDTCCRLLEIHSDWAVVSVPTYFPDCVTEPLEATIKQIQYTIAPGEVAQRLSDFWIPIWQRDPCIEDPFSEIEQIQHLMQDLPPHPDIQINMLDISLWAASIRKLKLRAARGVDGISAPELALLPPSLLQMLANTMSNYKEGFPTWFMTGIVCPLPKAALPMASQTRPITILAQLYRLWASVAASVILPIFASWMPISVTGMLPTRGAADSAYRQQWLIEEARITGCHLSGLVLDLKKCFNCIKWILGANLVHACGVPLLLLRQWMGSLKNLFRYWQIGGSHFPSGSTSCGFPEGDVMSVIVMVSLACCWISYVASRFPRQASISLSAYADNWSWTLRDSVAHHQALEPTLELLEIGGLTIDWDKTWFWVSHQSDSNQVAQNLSTLCPPGLPKKLDSAPDLGFQMQYSGSTRLGIKACRLEEGLRRLMRLCYMAHPLSVKEHIVRTSVFPCMFHAVETRPIAHDTLRRIRTRVANAILGHSYSCSPAIALLLTKNGILDPGFWTLKKTLVAARQFLLRCTLDTRKIFLDLAASFGGNLTAVKGPASALAWQLHQVGWSITRDGLLHVSAFLSISLTESSVNRLSRFLVQAWQEDLVQMFTSRHSIFGLPDIASLPTTQMLNRFPDHQRLHLLREISSGYQLETQKCFWDNSVDPEEKGLCRFCKQLDSKEHRLLFCPVGNEVRKGFPDVVESLTNSESSMSRFPVIHVHPDLAALQQMQSCHPPPCFSEAVCNKVRHFIDLGIVPHWFTDGSTQCPASPLSRYAAFAIILDLCENDEERIQISDQYRDLNEDPPSFVVAACSRCCGEQDILRAEVSAIVAILKQFPGVVHTDSLTGLRNVSFVLNCTQAWGFGHLEHYDLLLELWKQRATVNASITKVKAHQNIADITDPLERYWAMGNKVANDRAAWAASCLMPDLVTSLQKVHHQLQCDQALLFRVFQLHLELAKARAVEESQGVSVPVVSTGPTKQAIFEAFVQWEVQIPLPIVGTASTEHCNDSAWGRDIVCKFVSWLACLRWPPDIVGPLNKACGISWTELGISFAFYIGDFLPILRGVGDNRRVIFPGSNDSLLEWQVSVLELGVSCKHIYDHMMSLVYGFQMPVFSKQKVSSLYLQGNATFTTGWSVRPQIPCQRLVASLIKHQLDCYGGKGLEHTPTFPFRSRDDIVLPGAWNIRQRKAKMAQLKAARNRKLLEG